MSIVMKSTVGTWRLQSLWGATSLNYYDNNWGVMYFVHFIDKVCVLKYFLDWTWIRRERPSDSSEYRLWGSIHSISMFLEVYADPILLEHSHKTEWPRLIDLWFYLMRVTWLTNVWSVLSCTPRRPIRFFTDMVPHCI